MVALEKRGSTKVAQQGLAGRAMQDIVGIEIAVQDALRVQMLQKKQASHRNSALRATRILVSHQR